MVRGLQAWAVGIALSLGLAQGIPEPGLVIYGVVRNESAGVTNRLTVGTLTCEVRTAQGARVQVSTQLQNINDQFSFVLVVPLETRIQGMDLSPGTLELLSAGSRCQRTFQVNGRPVTLAISAQENFTVGPLDRARQDRVDLVTNLDSSDANGNGLPDWWEDRYFHRPVRPEDDADVDGASNLAEFVAGTDPTDPASRFAFIDVHLDGQQQLVIRWASSSNAVYSILRSTELLGAYTPVRTNVPASPPVNTFTDTDPPPRGVWFYRLKVE